MIESILWCSAHNCQEHVTMRAASKLHPDTLRDHAPGDWRHDDLGSWCPWHSPQQEAMTRGNQAQTIDM